MPAILRTFFCIAIIFLACAASTLLFDGLIRLVPLTAVTSIAVLSLALALLARALIPAAALHQGHLLPRLVSTAIMAAGAGALFSCAAIYALLQTYPEPSSLERLLVVLAALFPPLLGIALLFRAAKIPLPRVAMFLGFSSDRHHP